MKCEKKNNLSYLLNGNSLMLLICINIAIHFSILNGYVDITSNLNSDEEQLENFNDIRIQTASQNKTATVNCNKGFVLDNPYENRLLCNQGAWTVVKNESINADIIVDIDVRQELPNCREVLCKREPIIHNARLLKKVSLKSLSYNKFSSYF